MLAAVGTALWSLAARKSSGHPTLHAWLRLYLRLGLGAAMVGYGVAKLLTGQFAATPSFAELLRTYGDSSPMGLLWTFMAASRPYVLFAGLTEVLGGALLFAPSLATLGALICAASLTNVLMLNMSYDVPVKLYSFHLLLKAVFLLALQDIDNAKSTAKLTFSSSEADRLNVDGEINGHQVRAVLHREQRTFLLTTRGFHWINTPFNR